ncbi:alpha/beta fold hydrolase [Leucobacter luti]|uniref:Alpha-beta hydrolase superfamily lysophospholipase n=1 Tax=Leucobacter luti TaxID=340320 RepID=A0A4Q7U548_9MICO|nr:alpha/beta hydrolase [Leucobacter luti]MBL3701014.1 alpha/beta fold hydrolase [Leucobacter luti]RZT68765.1 alpha-beta hydrolase superfamily lysophospholipase [Leucobacter luti]
MALAVHHFPVASAAPPIVLLHGFAASADEDFVTPGWVDTLRTAGRTVIAVDLPGHGASPAIERPEDAITSAVLDAILDAAATVAPTGPLDVIGYSLGARLAWDLPGRSPRVRRLVLGGASPFEPFAAIEPAALTSALAGAAPTSPLVGMMAGMISAPGRDTASLAQLIPGLASEPFTPQNSAPGVPTLLVAGSTDQMTQGIEALLAELPHGSLTHVPGDHRDALDSAEFRSAALEFLAA